MALSVSEWIFRAEHEFGVKNIPSRHVFEKKGFKPLKIVEPCPFKRALSQIDRMRP